VVVGDDIEFVSPFFFPPPPSLYFEGRRIGGDGAVGLISAFFYDGDSDSGGDLQFLCICFCRGYFSYTAWCTSGFIPCWVVHYS